MRGKAEISYTDSRGNEFNLMSDGLRRIKSASFHEYSWNKDVSSKRFGEKLRAFKKDALSLSATIYFDGPDREKHLNEFHDATEYDIVKGEAGTLTWEEYSIKCFVISSKTHPAEERFGAPAANEVVFYCPDPFWTKVQSYSSYTANDRPVKAARIAASKNPIKELTGELVHFDDAKEGSYLPKTELTLEPKQDLHGYDHPWVGGAGKNLFDKNAKDTSNGYYAGRWVRGASGVESTDANYSISEYIPLKTNTQYTVSGTYGTNPGVAFYNSSKQYVSGYGYGVGSDNPKFTFTTPSDIVYGRFSIVNALVDKMQLELGSTATAYEPYENICPLEPYDEIELYHNGSYSEHNIWDEEWENGTILPATGENYPLTTKIRSKNYIPIEPGVQYCISQATSITDTDILYFYDKNKAFIIHQNFTHGTSINFVFTPPENAKYMRFINRNESYHNDICINVSDPDFNGQYEPYHNSRPKLDTKPYLIRPASQLGTKAYDKLVGMSVGWNQKQHNGDFKDGTSGYSSSTGTMSVSNGVMSFIANVKEGHLDTVNDTVSGHKFLSKIDIQTSATGYVYVLYKAGAAKYVSKTNQWETIAGIFDPGYTGAFSFPRIYDARPSGWDAIKVRNRNLIDLTAALTPQVADYIYSLETANAGDGVAFFREHFPEVYYSYNPGELISTAPTAKEVTGKNLWSIDVNIDDNKYTHSYAPGDLIKTLSLLVGETVAWSCATTGSPSGVPIGHFKVLDSTGKELFYMSPGVSRVIPDVPFNDARQILVYGSAYGGTVNNCQLELGSTATEYEPYHVTRYPYPNVRLGGIPKIVNGQLSSDGDTLDSDGALKRKYGLVDLGTLNWNMSSNENYFYSVNLPYNSPINARNIINGKGYDLTTYANGADLYQGTSDKVLGLSLTSIGSSTKAVYVRDSSYTTSAAFKTAMSGVMLLYELAEPYTEHVQPFVSPQKVDPLGLEIYEDKRPVPIPVNHETRYYDGVMRQFKASQFGGDVYGLTIDLVSGVISKTYRKVNLGDLTWAFYDYYGHPGGYSNSLASSIKPATNTTTAISNKLRSVSDNDFNSYMYNSGGDIAVNPYSMVKVTYPGVSSDATLKTAMNGVELAYELKTPETYQLTPRQLAALTGDNYLWGSDGIVSLAYISDFDPYMLTAADGTPITPQEGLVYIIQEGAYKDHEFIWNGEEYLDLTPAIIKAYEPAHPYAYDYKADFESYLTLTNDNVLGSSYVAVIYGPCTNPDIILANDGDEDDVEIAINTDVPAGGRLVVDMTDKTVTKYMPDGSIINAFGQRDLDAGYLWTKVPYGLSHVIWDGSFDFDLLLIEERSEPKWLLG